MGRVYIPQEDLERFGVSRGGTCARTLTLGCVTFCVRGRTRLELLSKKAWNYPDRVHPDSRAALWALVRTYSGLLPRIESRGYDVFAGRVRLSTAEKMGIPPARAARLVLPTQCP